MATIINQEKITILKDHLTLIVSTARYKLASPDTILPWPSNCPNTGNYPFRENVPLGHSKS